MTKRRFSDDIYNIPQAPGPEERTIKAGPVRADEQSRSRGARDVLRRPGARNYEFAQNDRLMGNSGAMTLSADQAVFGALQSTRNRARELENSNPHIRKFLIMARTNVVGAKALRFQSKAADMNRAGDMIADKPAQKILERAYLEFSKSKNFTMDCRLDRRRFMQMALTRYLVDGECIIRRVRGAENPFLFSTEIIDADLLDYRLNSPKTAGRGRIIMGIEVDTNNKPVAYYFKEQPNTLWGGMVTTPLPGEYNRVPASEITHYYEPDRPGQTRGITYLAPSGLRAKLLDGLEQSILVGFRVAASKMGFFKMGDDYEGDELTADDVPSEVAPGQLDILPQGLEFQEFNPGYPNADYDGIKKSVVKEIASGAGISYPELGNDYAGVSYSAGQIGVQADALVWENMQSSLIEIAEEAIFLDWLDVQLIFGLLRFPLARKSKYEEHRFQPPKRRNIDPLKTAKANELNLGLYAADPYEVAANGGNDLEESLDNFARAIKEAQDRGLAVPAAWLGGQPVEDPIADALLVEEIEEEKPKPKPKSKPPEEKPKSKPKTKPAPAPEK